MTRILVGVLVLVVGNARAGEMEDRVAAVRAAVEAGDTKTLHELAQRPVPSAFNVADELCYRGHADAAEAFARAVEQPGTEHLLAYVAHLREHPTSRKRRQVLYDAGTATAAGRPKEALALLDGPGLGGSDVTEMKLGFQRGLVLRRLKQHEKSAAAFAAAAAVAVKMGWPLGEATCLREVGRSHYDRSDWARAVDPWRDALRISRELRNRSMAARVLTDLGNVHRRLQRLDEAMRFLREAIEIQKALGNRAGVAGNLVNLGHVYKRLGELDRAEASYRSGMNEADAIGHKRFRATALSSLSAVLRSRGKYEEALQVAEKAVEMDRRDGARKGLAASLTNLGAAYAAVGRYTEALAVHREALASSLEWNDRVGIATSRLNLAEAHRARGEFEQAMVEVETALAIAESIPDLRLTMIALSNRGALRHQTSDFPGALSDVRRLLGLVKKHKHRLGEAHALSQLGGIHAALRDHVKAVEAVRGALAIYRAVRSAGNVAAAHRDVGYSLLKLGDHDAALAEFERALALSRQLEDREGEAAALTQIGNLHLERGEPARALPVLESATKIQESVGDRWRLAGSLADLSWAHHLTDDHEAALRAATRAYEIAVEIGVPPPRLRALAALVPAHLGAKDPQQAARCAREAVDLVPLLAQGLSERSVTRVREGWAPLFEVATLAGVRLEDPATTSHFIESGRAVTLRDSLGGRSALGDAGISAESRAAERAARAAVAEAQARLNRAHARGKRGEIRRRRKALQAAQEALLEQVDAIQRETRSVSDVTHPRPAPLAEQRATLAPGEALVSYAFANRTVVALVVTAGGARIVRLGDPEPVAETVGSLDLKADGDPAEALARVRRTLLDSLELPKDTRRLLVSPHGAIAFVPFAALAPGLEVAYVPSATTYAVLRGADRARGSGVLALGDPEYGGPRATKRSALRGGRALAPLPGSRAEAKAVGDTVLLGAEATETGFRAAVAKRERWRAIHFACHGLVNMARPQFSSLALTPAKGEDGFLTALEIYRTRIPADLVVLSACDTARGKVYRSEGVVGLMRSFMQAGAPRVIVSLWRVDDDATRALMTKFYALWNPAEAEPLPAAAALRQAQDLIRKEKKWSHPKHWAAWQLWGLPD